MTGKNKTVHAGPNIIFILADDLGYGDLACYGQKLIRTPHLDNMAAHGMRFTQFYAGATVCAPSRAALMTGLHTGHTYIRGNKEVKPEGQWPLPDSAITIAEILKGSGYVTGDFGKWGLGPVGSSGDPNRQGFDQFFGYNCQRQSHNFYPDHLWQNNKRIDYPNTPQKQEFYAAQIIHDRALHFIDQNKAQRFFLYLSYTLPHAALQVPADSIFENYKKQFHEQPRPIPQSWDGVGYQPQEYPRSAYATMVTKLDNYVGQILSALKTGGIDRNTLVIFTSDNGPHKEGGHDPAFFNSSGVYKGIKRDLYEGGIRVPMIAFWPGRIKDGSVSHHIGASWDFMPTFSALAGTRSTAETDGVSFLPTLLGEGNQSQHHSLYWEFHEGGGKQAARMGKWKGVKLDVKNNRNTAIELYDLESDPKEEKNIAAAYPDIVKQIDKAIMEAHRENKAFPFLD